MGLDPSHGKSQLSGNIANCFVFLQTICMAFTQTQLDAIEAALAQGTTRVKYENKEVEYRSLEELMKLRDLIRSELGLIKKGQRLYASHDKGLK